MKLRSSTPGTGMNEKAPCSERVLPDCVCELRRNRILLVAFAERTPGNEGAIVQMSRPRSANFAVNEARYTSIQGLNVTGPNGASQEQNWVVLTSNAPSYTCRATAKGSGEQTARIKLYEFLIS